jgi:hypothetical protein
MLPPPPVERRENAIFLTTSLLRYLLFFFQFQFVLFSYAIFRYFLQKPVKKGSYPLHPGVQGFFITCDGGREHQASREALNILDSVLYLRSFFSFSTIN